MTNTSASVEQLRGWVGRTLVDSTGDKIGRIEDIYMDEATGQPEWLAVATGWFGRRVSFVPISGTGPRGDDVESRWDKAHIKDAPHAEPDGQLSRQEEVDLYRHYGVRYTGTGTGTTMTGTGTGTAQARTAQAGTAAAGTAAAAGAAGTDGRRADAAAAAGTARTDMAGTGARAAAATGPTGVDKENATPATATGDMVRSEEELQIGKETHESGRVRLHKWVETEHVTRTVPVSHEEVRLQREPIGADEAAAVTDGADLSESDQEMVLSEEIGRAHV